MTDHPPIPVLEAIEALKYAIKVHKKAAPGPWKWFEVEDGSCRINPLSGGMVIAQCETGKPFSDEQKANAHAIVSAMNGYRGALEYLLSDLKEEVHARHDIHPEWKEMYAAVAPIWERWKAEVKR